MKNTWKITLAILSIIIIGAIWFLNTPADLRTPSIKDGISEEEYTKGKALTKTMQEAYGGKDTWLAFKTGSYVQTADWYDNKLGIAGWDTLPQQFEMRSTLGTDNSEFTLLNGKNTGQIWGIQEGQSYQKNKAGQIDFIPNEQYQHKLVYKNYWFQFPFRISEAPIIAYAGEASIEGKTYDLVYATWGTEAANGEYDQYILYLDQETRMIEWLHFTVREKLKPIQMAAQFTDFKNVNGIICPFNQYITFGKPQIDGIKMHENRYEWIEFGDQRVFR